MGVEAKGRKQAQDFISLFNPGRHRWFIACIDSKMYRVCFITVILKEDLVFSVELVRILFEHSTPVFSKEEEAEAAKTNFQLQVVFIAFSVNKKMSVQFRSGLKHCGNDIRYWLRFAD